MIAPLSRPRNARRGAVAALTAILMVALLAMLAFAIDLSYWAVVHTEAQTAADAACMAGAGKLLDQTRMAPIVSGVPVQTSDDILLAKKEAVLFASLNKVGGVGGDLQEADIDIGYMASPFSHGDFNQAGELDTSGWPDRPYNAVRVRIHRNKDHSGGPVNLFFAKIVDQHQMDVAATATAVFPMGQPTVSCGKVIPFVLHIDLWRALVGADGAPVPDANGNVTINFPVTQYGSRDGSISTLTAPVQFAIGDNFGIIHPRNPDDPISVGADGNRETNMYPIPVPLKDALGNRILPPGGYGSIDIGQLSNGADVLQRQLQDGPTSTDFASIYDHPAPTYAPIASPQTEASFLQGKLVMVNDQFSYIERFQPITLQADPGISALPIETGALYARGEVRLVPLFDTLSSNGNNAYYRILGFAPITIVDADVEDTDNKRIIIQPTLNYEPCLPIDPNANPVTFFAGQLQLVR